MHVGAVMVNHRLMFGFSDATSFRSVLIVRLVEPGAIERASIAQADAIALEIEAGAPLQAAAELLGPDGTPVLLVADATDPETTRAALQALRPARPSGVLLRRADSRADLQRLGATLAVEEARASLDDGAFGVVVLAESGGALFGLNELKDAGRRLRAFAWDGEALADDLGAEDAREVDGRWLDPCQTARTLILAAAADARLPAIDSPFTGADADAFRREAEAARRDGFAAKFVLNREQAAIANDVFAARR